MPMPFAYESASADFERFLAAAIGSSGLSTRNQAYTMAQGVLQVFRRRLTIRDAARLADVLPPVADVEALERVIATLPPAAADFWRV